MAELILWVDGRAAVFGEVEKICPERHVKQNQWQPEWNEEYLTSKNKNCYDYISGYECIFNHPIDHEDNDDLLDEKFKLWQNLQAAKEQGTNVPITNIAHFTQPMIAKVIGRSGGFKGGKKKISENTVTRRNVAANFSWWSPVFTADERNQVRVHLAEAIRPFLNEREDNFALQNQFATSGAFWPNRRQYGSVLFQYGINELCQYYSKQVGDMQSAIQNIGNVLV